MPDIRSALKVEEASLEAELQKVPVYLKLQQVRKLLALYGDDGSQSQLAPSNLVRVSAEGNRVRTPNADRVQALEIAEALIAGRTTPTKTSEILAAIEMKDIEIGGGSPVSNLSAMLSRSDKFTPHGRAGWTLSALGVESSHAGEPAEDLGVTPEPEVTSEPEPVHWRQRDRSFS